MRTLHIKEYFQDLDTENLVTAGIVVAITAVLMTFLLM